MISLEQKLQYLSLRLDAGLSSRCSAAFVGILRTMGDKYGREFVWLQGKIRWSGKRASAVWIHKQVLAGVFDVSLPTIEKRVWSRRKMLSGFA